MSWNYACPHCKAMLNPNDTVNLVAAFDSKRVLIGLNPKPGNYELYFPHGVTVNKGTAVDLFCPVCHANLKSKEKENLCVLEMLGTDEPQQILFSRILGEEATYVVSPDRVKEKHGKHTEKYDKDVMFTKYVRF